MAQTVVTDSSDGCRQIGGQRPDTSLPPGLDARDAWQRAFARGAEFTCTITPTLALRVRVAGDTSLPSLDSIVVFEGAAPRRLQVLRLDGGSEVPSPETSHPLRAVDLDADGSADLMLGTSWGATGNVAYAVWRFDPRAHRFAADSALSSMFNPAPVPGRACVRTFSNGSAVDDDAGLYCLRAGRWILDSLESHRWNRDAHSVIHEISARRGDSLVVLRHDVQPDSL